MSKILNKVADGEYRSEDGMFVAYRCRPRDNFGQYVTRYDVHVHNGGSSWMIANGYDLDVRKRQVTSLAEAEALCAKYRGAFDCAIGYIMYGEDVPAGISPPMYDKVSEVAA